jgi:two-component system OmpR family response regulator
MRLLVVEDEPKMADLLRRALSEEGYAVDVAHQGEQALEMGVGSSYDLLLLDLMLPDMSGLEVCRRLRGWSQNVPVIMLTARDATPDKVEGLDSGADDYLTKPFSLEELFARVRALLRRGPAERPPILAAAGIELDPGRHHVSRSGQPVELTPKEFSLLECFMRHAGQTLTRATLIDHVWDIAYEGDSNVVDVYVRYLREKIDRPFGMRSLETIRGIGYRLSTEA